MLWTADSVYYRDVSMEAAYSGSTLIWKKRLHSKKYQIGPLASEYMQRKCLPGNLVVFVKEKIINQVHYPDKFVANVVTSDPNFVNASYFPNTTYANTILPIYDVDNITILDPNEELLVGEVLSVGGNRVVLRNYYTPMIGDKTNSITGYIYRNKYNSSSYNPNDYSGSLFAVTEKSPGSYNSIYINNNGNLEVTDDYSVTYHLGSQSIYNQNTGLYSQTRFIHDYQTGTGQNVYNTCYVYVLNEVE